jgi:hypothetical protein
MNPTVNAMAIPAQTPAGPAIHFLNVAYFFQLLYNLFFSAHTASVGGLAAFLSTFWIVFTVLSFLFCLICLGVLVYYTMRLNDVVAEDAKRYTTISKHEADEQLEDSRWTYIKNLTESGDESQWRQAIIEADIMLEELLTKLGYDGNTIGDKLKMANPKNFHTLNDAWEAHKVRNEIAHQGSTYQLTDHIAYRTINHYENVFREFHVI